MKTDIRINGYLVLDSKGERIYSRYFDSIHNDNFEKERIFEKDLFKNSKKTTNNFSNKEINIFYLYDTIVVFKVYEKFILYIFSESDENELIMEDIMLTFDSIIKENFKNRSSDTFFDSFPHLIIYFDDIIEDGYIINLNSKDILNQRNKILIKEKEKTTSKLASVGRFFFGRN